MCVIYACQTAMPDIAELRRGSETNTDGAGIAWLQDGIIHWKKDLNDWEKVVDFIEKSKLKFPYAIHFRSASVGGNSNFLAHPFPIGKGAPNWVEGTAPEVLFHNGHLSNWSELVLSAGMAAKEPFPVGAWSDSRALAWLVHLRGVGILPFVVGQSRVLMFNATPDVWEGDEYTPSEDHFSYYGPGWIHKKEGWSQSVDTYDRWQRTPGRWVHHGAAWEMADDDDAVDATKSTTSTATTNSAPYIWTVEELVDIMNKLQREQADAKLATGV